MVKHPPAPRRRGRSLAPIPLVRLRRGWWAMIRRAAYVSVLGASLAGSAPTAHARDPASPTGPPGGETGPPGSEPDAVGDTLVVEGRGARDPAASTVRIDGARLKRPAADVADLLDDEPSLRVTRLGGLGSYAVVSVRGARAEHTALYFDGFPLGGDPASPVDVSLLPTAGIARIDVIRGVAPARFGASVIGGVIDVQPTGELPAAGLRLGAGSFATRDAAAYVSRRVGAASLSAAVEYQGALGDFSYRDDRATRFDAGDDRIARRTHNAFDRVGLVARAAAAAGPVRVRAVLWAAGLLRELPGPGALPYTRAKTDEGRALAGVTTDGRIGPVRLEAAVHYGLRGTRLIDPWGETGGGPRTETRAFHTPGVRLGALYRPVESLELALVAAWRAVWIDTGAQAPGAAARSRTSALHALSIAAEAAWSEPRSGLILVGTARGEAALYNVRTLRDGAPVTVDAHRTFPGGRLGIAHRAYAGLRPTLNAGWGVRMPGAEELTGDTGARRGNPRLAPERGLMLDAGLEWSRPFGVVRVTLGVEGFASWYRDLVIWTMTARNVLVPLNTGAARILGVEGRLRLDAPWFALRAHVTYMAPVDTSSNPTSRGRDLPLRPRLRAFARADGRLDVPLGNTETLRAAPFVEVDYTGSSVSDPAGLVRIGARTLVAAGLNLVLVNAGLRLGAEVRNLLNATAYDLVGFPLPGRAAFVHVGWDGG